MSATGGSSAEPPPEVMSLWEEVAHQLDGSQSNEELLLHDVVEALESAATHLSTSHEAQRFVHGHVRGVIADVLEKRGIGKKLSKSRAEKILLLALDIANQELMANDANGGSNYWPLRILAIIFDKGRPLYDDPLTGGDEEGASGEAGGHPEVRIKQIKTFHIIDGFDRLAAYVSSRRAVDQYFSHLNPILRATFDAVFLTDDKEGDSAHSISKSVMRHLVDLGGEELVKLPISQIRQVCLGLQLISKRLTFSNRQTLPDFGEFWRALVLKLLRSGSMEHRLFGLREIVAMIESTHLPTAFVVSGAGCSFVNGRYELSFSLIKRGCIAANAIVCYEHVVPTSDPDVEARGKRLKVHPCVMTEEMFSSYSSTWWYLSEGESGTDYYFHKSKPHEHDRPPLSGWDSTGSGIEPVPTLKAEEELVPIGEGRNTLGHQLSTWIAQNNVFDIVLETHSNMMDAPASMVRFLSVMCNANNSLGAGDRSAINLVLGQRMQMLESILPVVSEPTTTQQSAPPVLMQSSLVSPPSSAVSSLSSSSDYFSAMAAAKQRLASAERWKQSMERSLNEYLAASKEVRDARSYLIELECSREVINVDDGDDTDDADEEAAGRSKRRRRLYKTP